MQPKVKLTRLRILTRKCFKFAAGKSQGRRGQVSQALNLVPLSCLRVILQVRSLTTRNHISTIYFYNIIRGTLEAQGMKPNVSVVHEYFFKCRSMSNGKMR